MTRTEMMNNVVRTFGHEDSITILFFEMADLYKDEPTVLKAHYHFLMMAKPSEDEE